MADKRGYSDVLIGLQYGDEGKARIIDKILQKNNYGVVARFNGGPNAGHSLEFNNKRIVLHSIPSGIFYSDKVLYIGSGCVVNPEKLLKEINEIESSEIKIKDRLKISSNVSLIQPHHILLDKIQGGFIGTTSNGIGAAYSDQAIRAEGKKIKNIKFGDYLANPSKLKEDVLSNLKAIIESYNNDANVKNAQLIPEQIAEKFHNEVLQIKDYLESDPLFLDKLNESEKNVLFEGAQSCMLDMVYGTTPFITSSRTIAAAAYTGGDISFKHHKKTFGVAKAIMSRVGNGPFVSELGGNKSEEYCMEEGGKKYSKDIEKQNYNPSELLKSNDMFKIGIALRILGNEYGSTTGRPRRIGILDLVMLKQNCRLNGIDEVYINKFDCLFDFSKTSLSGIPVVTAYILDGKIIDYLPTNSEKAYKTKPIIEYWPHIPDISSIRTYSELPVEVKHIIKTIEERIGVKVAGIGVGPERDQFISMD